MNRTVTQPFHFVTDTGAEVWLFHFIWNDDTQGLQGFCEAVIAIEAIFNALLAVLTVFLVYKAFRYPPVHMNLVIITNYGVSMLAISSLGRTGQILFQDGILGEIDEISSILLIFSHIRMTGAVTVAMYGMSVYSERCFALRFVRDYERKRRLYIGAIYVISKFIVSNLIAWLLIYEYLPGYPGILFSIIPHAACFFLIKRLLLENEKRLDKLNSRSIRRPTIESRMGVLPRKFFGDSSKDMYTLSLRLQLDENIWCCKQLARGNHTFLYGMVLNVALFGIPPLFHYSEDCEWILHVLVAIGNLSVPIISLTIEVIIAWSLDKLRPNVFPAWLINYFGKRQVAPAIDENKTDAETNNYFDQLTQQWEHAYRI